MSIPYTPLPAFDLYCRCKATAAQLNVSSKPSGPRLTTACNNLRTKLPHFMRHACQVCNTFIYRRTLDSNCLKYRSNIVSWVWIRRLHSLDVNEFQFSSVAVVVLLIIIAIKFRICYLLSCVNVTTISCLQGDDCKEDVNGQLQYPHFYFVFYSLQTSVLRAIHHPRLGLRAQWHLSFNF